MKTNLIYNEDCLVGMKKLSDNKVDLILTDPPYNISRERTFSRDNAKDVSLYFGDWDNIENKEFYKWLKIVLLEMKRVLKPNGQLLMFSPRNWEYESVIDDVLHVKRTLIWHKNNPTPQFLKVSYLTSYEMIRWAVQDEEVKNKDITFNFDKQKNMHDVLKYPICMGNERTEHPTQKPLDLINKLINIHSNEGDLVLDPFIGSGTTAVACLKTNRKFMGFEREEKYYNIALKRIGKFDKKYYEFLSDEDKPEQQQLF